MTYLTSIRVNTLTRILPVAFAVGAIALVSARAHAADSDQLDPVQLDPITVSAPAVKIVDRDAASGAQTEQVTITARSCSITACSTLHARRALRLIRLRTRTAHASRTP